jgi:anti-anti-sigma factor
MEVVKIQNDLDVGNTDTLRAVLKNFLRSEANVLVLDFEGVALIDSAALGVLIHGQEELKRAGKRLILLRLNPHIQKIFQITRLYKHFEIFRSLEEAGVQKKR